VCDCLQLSKDINTEIRKQNSHLDDLGADMTASNSMLENTLGKLQHLVANGGSMHVCHLTGFMVLAFVLLYWLFMR
jgi:hypothetical protein